MLLHSQDKTTNVKKLKICEKMDKLSNFKPQKEF